MIIETVHRFLKDNTFRIAERIPKAAPLIERKDLKKNNVLEIDGGGIKGVIPAYQLWAIEFREGDKFITNNFKTLWGTSTGSIIVTMIALGYSAFDILRMYVELGADIFQEQVSLFFLPKYSNFNLKNILKKYVGDKTFLDIFNERGVDLKLQVCNITHGTQETWDVNTVPNMKLRNAVLCSVSAPTFFPEVPLNGCVYVDGGSGVLNCTLTKAVNDQIFVKEVAPKDFFVFSLGCGRQALKYGINKLNKLLWIVYFGREQSIIQQEKDFEYRKADLKLQGLRWNIDLTDKLNQMDKTNHIPMLIKAVEDE